MGIIENSKENFISDFVNKITDDKQRKHIISKVIYISFCIISAFMSIINIITERKVLLIATAAFAALCFIDWFLSMGSEKMQKMATVLFAFEIIILFSYFIITGGTDNFSIVWVLLLPTLGLFFFGLKIGSIICFVILGIMLASFYIPEFSKICTDYGNTFTTRFPVVFIASYAVSVLLELIRFYTAKELNILKEKYYSLYEKDPLTGLLNRYGLGNTFDSISDSSDRKIGIMIYDIDFFKSFNDTYGHECGDYILKELSSYISGLLTNGAVLHRWGGEEFLAVYPDDKDVFKNAQFICDSVNDHIFEYEDKTLHLSISVGVITCDNLNVGDSYDGLISIADGCLYEAKNTGRNKVVSKEI